MDEFVPKDDNLWGFIAKAMWTGLVSYIVVLFVAFIRDVFRKTRFSRSPLQATISRSRFSPIVWHRWYLRIYRDTSVFYFIEVLRLLINLTVCIHYIIGTYRRNVPQHISIVNRVTAGFFIADLASQIWAAESAISSVTAVAVFFDAFSFPSLIMASGPSAYLNFAFLRSIQAYVAFSRLEKRLLVQVFSSKRLFAKLAMQCITLFYALACGIQLLEVPGDLLSVDFRDTWLAFGEWNFFNSVYFVIVTLSTVGYGDFSPATVQGRLFTLMIIIIGIVIFTAVIGEIVEQSSRGRGSGWFIKNPDTRHVIVTGNPTLADLVLFVSEFYSDSRESNTFAQIVVLIENPTWTDPEWFQYIAKNSFLQSRLTFLVGCLRNPVDTQRARLSSADAVFFLTSPSSGEDPSQQDTRTVLNILAVRNARTDIPIYAQTLLEESNLQTGVALKTPTSFSKGTYFRDTKAMRKNASYQGLFRAVLKAELNDLPRAHLRNGRLAIAEILRYYNEAHEQEDAIASKGKGADLERSHLICLQETHMALITGNIKVNGVATLLSNMYLDVQAEKPSPDDPSWMWEYHMGASCSLQYAIIPEKLHGVPLKELAVELFHVGLVLVGTSDAGHIHLNPVLDTERFLRRGDVGMFLTYHHQDYVAAALYLVTSRHQMGQLRHPLLHPSPSGDDMTQDAVSLDVTNLEHPDTDMNENQEVPHHAVGDHVAVESSPQLHVPSSRSNARTSHGESDEDILGGNLLDYEKSIVTQKCSDGYMPDALAGHVIVAMEGDAPLGSLPLFLKNLWRKDKRRSMRKARRARVVVIHPSISDQYHVLFSRHEGKSLFFVEGSPSSGETWKRAKLKTAKSVATMADYTQPWNVSDARTIFTLLTLDVNTACDHDVFICSELVDEKSLEFLREPTHPRRRGAMLGEASLRITANFSGSQLSTSPVQSPVASPVPRDLHTSDAPGKPQTRSVAFRDGEEDPSEAAQEAEGTSPHSAPTDGGQVAVTVAPREDSSNNPPNVLRPVNNLVNSVKNLKNSAIGAATREGHDSVRSGQTKESKQKNPKNTTKTVLEPNKMEVDKEGSGVDPANKPGAARARRGSLFSRSRYASGELLIHSSAITLLVREYVEPGFANFYADLLGTRQPTPGLKIRLVRIPKSFFTPIRGAVFRNDRPLVPYITVFKSLIRHGATPLGIYRSGDAPALIPFKNRHRRGPAIMEELEPYWKRFEEEDGTSSGRRNGSFFGSLFGLVKGVTPHNMREAQGHNEINGARGSTTTSDDYDTDFDSDDDDEVFVTGTVGDKDTAAGEDAVVKTGVGMMSTGGKKEDRSKGSSFTAPGAPGAGTLVQKFLGNGKESFEVPGSTKYRERPVTQNLLPYVFTMPDPNALCAETDGIYILCHPSLELSDKWTEAVANKNDNDSGVN